MIRQAKDTDLPGILLLYKHLFPKENYSNIADYQEEWETILTHYEQIGFDGNSKKGFELRFL